MSYSGLLYDAVRPRLCERCAMADPTTPPNPRFANDDDAGFPPLGEPAVSADEDTDGSDDYEGDFHEDGGGD
jgi:hypothetical protein